MRNYFFLTDYYLPKPSAVGVCVEAIANELQRRGNRVFVICFGDGLEADDYHGVTVIKVKVPSFLASVSNKGFISKFYHFKSVFGKLIHINQYPLRSKTLVNRIVSETESIIKSIPANEEIEIIAAYNPIETVIAGEILKTRHPELIAVYYSADSLSNEKGNNGILSPSKRELLGKRMESRLFNLYDYVLIMECHKAHYSSEFFESYQKKIKDAGFPLIKKNTIASNRIKNDNKIVFTYAGTLYKKLRNPKAACDFLLELLPEINGVAYFLGGGDCEEYLKYYEEASNGRIVYLGMQPHEVALDYINDADVLISIGNKQSPMAPSKIYEYMSTGKPIIHFCSWEGDNCIAPLNQYGNSKIIFEDTAVDDQMIAFCKSAKAISIDMINEMFFKYTPEYSACLLENLQPLN